MFGFVIIHRLKVLNQDSLYDSINLKMFACLIVHPLRGPEPEFCMPFNNFENVLISHGNINKAPIVLTN